MTDENAADRKAILADVLVAASKIAQRLSWSVARLVEKMPLDSNKIRLLTDQDEETLDAFLHRFTSLIIVLQDGVGRSILEVEEEDLTSRSRKDQRLLLEKLGALDPTLGFGDMAELRNKISHRYPDDLAKQAEILNDVFARSRDALEGFNGLRTFADKRHFDSKLEVQPVEYPSAGEEPPKRS